MNLCGGQGVPDASQSYIECAETGTGCIDRRTVIGQHSF